MRLPYKFTTVYVWLGNFVPAVNSEAQSYGDQDWSSELEMPDNPIPVAILLSQLPIN